MFDPPANHANLMFEAHLHAAPLPALRRPVPIINFVYCRE